MSLSDLQKLHDHYQTQKKYFNALIYGSYGTGKTELIKTARRPILIDSFDPGGTTTLRDEINEGKWLFADTRWEKDNVKQPTIAMAWEKEYEARKKSKFFDDIGTYVIDSITTFSDTFANQFLKVAGRPGGFLYQQDYNPLMASLTSAIKDILSLPCDVILIAHEDAEKDEATGKMFIGPNFIGKSSRAKLPLLFDEIYVTISKATAKGIEYSLLTQANGLYRARTRLGKGGIFDTYEKPDIKALLAKAKFLTDDKPY